MADAPAHGKSFGGADSHEEEDCKLALLIQKCAQQHIKIIEMPIGGSSPEPSFKKCKEIYQDSKGLLYEIRPFQSSGSDISSIFRDSVVSAVICAAPKA
jgi:hypothetical protein